MKNSACYADIYNPNAPGMNIYRKAQLGIVEDLNIEKYAYTNEYDIPEQPLAGEKLSNRIY